MNSLMSIVGKYASPIITGLVAAAVVLALAPSADIEGAASGKKASKKKQNGNIWGEIAKEVTPKERPVPVVTVAAPQMDLNGDLGVEIPDEPLSDPVDPARCARNLASRPSEVGGASYIAIRGEVRSYAQQTHRDYPSCFVEIYPRGCDRSYRFLASAYNSGDALQGNQLCSMLSNAVFFKKEILVAAPSANGEIGNGRYSIDYVSVSNQSFDSFTRDYELIRRGAQN